MNYIANNLSELDSIPKIVEGKRSDMFK